jgi:hypothetical protein
MWSQCNCSQNVSMVQRVVSFQMGKRRELFGLLLTALLIRGSVLFTSGAPPPPPSSLVLRDTLAIASDAVIQRTDGFMGYSVCYVAVSRRGDDKVYCDNVTHLTSIFITWAMRGWVDTRQKPPSDPITREFSDVIVHDVVYSTMHTSKHNPMKCKSSSLFRPPFEGIASLTFSLTLYCGVAILSNLFVCTN